MRTFFRRLRETLCALITNHRSLGFDEIGDLHCTHCHADFM